MPSSVLCCQNAGCSAVYDAQGPPEAIYAACCEFCGAALMELPEASVIAGDPQEGVEGLLLRARQLPRRPERA